MINKCIICDKEFETKRKSKYCSTNCRVKAYYRKNHENARINITGKTKEEKLKYRADYMRNRYNEDEEYREKIKEYRRNRYNKNKEIKKHEKEYAKNRYKLKKGDKKCLTEQHIIENIIKEIEKNY